MLKKMLLNGEDLHFSKQNLPLLIHGDDGYGASLFSVSVVADLYAQGANLVFLCGYHMARDEFKEQTQSEDDSIDKRVVFIPSEHPELLGDALGSLNDSAERVIFLKNFDLFDEKIFSFVKDLPNLVMMGNIDKCSYAAELLDKRWATQIYFSMPQTTAQTKIPKLEKYKGYLESNDKEGVVSLVQ